MQVMSDILTSTTIPSTRALRLRAVTPRIRSLGDRPLYELFAELTALSSAVMPRIEAYAALTLHAELIEAYGGRDLAPTIYRVK
jgi:hypothetical protein